MTSISSVRTLASDDGLSKSLRARAMAAVGLAVLLSMLDYSAVNIAMPTISRDIQASNSAAIWVINAYQLTSLIALLPIATLGEKFGHARICRIGLVIFMVASALCAVSHTLPELAAARALQGLGGACILGVNAALIRHIYPAKYLGRGIALNGLLVALGVALGPSIAAVVLSVASWNWLFLINLPLGAAALYFAASSLPTTPKLPVTFDLSSTLLLSIGLGSIVMAGDSFAQDGSLRIALALLIIGLAGMVALIRLQASRPHPLVPVDLLTRPDFSVAFVTGFLAFVASNFFMISMPFNLTGVLHRGAVETGLIMTAWPVAIVVTAPIVGRLADRYPAALLTSLGMGVVSIAFLLLCLLPDNPSNLEIFWRIALAGGGFSMVQPPNNKAMLNAAPHHRIAGASGMISVSRLSGQTAGGMFVSLTLAFAHPAPTNTCLALASFVAAAGATLSLTRLFSK